jgi:GNAT superfamily N-acetyltransferase
VLTVRPVRTRADLRRFIALPYRLHARDPNWVPPLRRDVRQVLDRHRNPFFEHAEAEYSLAVGGRGEVLGRIAAIANRLHNETHHDRVGFHGFFESIDDGEVAAALFDAAGKWLRARGLEAMRGPASFSVNDECGLLVDGFGTPNVIMMPHNPSYYARLHELNRFTAVKNLIAYEGGPRHREGPPLPDRLGRAVEIGARRYRVTLRPLRLPDFKAEVEIVKRLYNRCWERNWGAIPMTDHEIDHLAAQFRPVVLPDLVPFAEIDGEPIGFALALPDFNQVLRRYRGGHLFPAALELLWALKTNRFSRCRVLLLGVVPEHRGKGIDAMLYHWLWTRAGRRGIYWGEAGWVLEDNRAMNAGLAKMGFTPYKTYRLYQRPL